MLRFSRFKTILQNPELSWLMLGGILLRRSRTEDRKSED
jgi:hypothetical protein